MKDLPVLKDALVIARRALKERGFTAEGMSFCRKADDGNRIVLSLQKSVRSSPAEAMVTVNYGVYSARIERKLHYEASTFDVSKAHWRKRLRGGEGEKWLHVKATDAVDDVSKLILGEMESALAELQEHSTDEALRNEWLSGLSPGITAMQRLLFLAVLVNELGPIDKLKGIVSDLRRLTANGVHERLVEGQLAEAGIRVDS